MLQRADHWLICGQISPFLLRLRRCRDRDPTKPSSELPRRATSVAKHSSIYLAKVVNLKKASLIRGDNAGSTECDKQFFDGIEVNHTIRRSRNRPLQTYSLACGGQ
jgi:hypothetical protein